MYLFRRTVESLDAATQAELIKVWRGLDPDRGAYYDVGCYPRKGLYVWDQTLIWSLPHYMYEDIRDAWDYQRNPSRYSNNPNRL